MIIKSKTYIFSGRLFLVLVAVFFFSSCQKDDTSDFVKVAQVSSQHLIADLDVLNFFSVFQQTIYDTTLNHNDTAIIDSATVYLTHNATTGETTYIFDYAEGTITPDFKIKSGQIEALLDKDFDLDGATFTATFVDFKINETYINGTISYINTGEEVGGNAKFVCVAGLVFSTNLQILQYQGNKEILWTNGFADPTKTDEQEFSVSGSSTSQYANPESNNIQEASIAAEIETFLIVNLACSKLVKSGRIIFNEVLSDYTETIVGDFIDNDLDGCGDKVMLKNNRNFGYPVYI